jgi:MerR family mercuric resistance operon transcriptional regulator
MTRMTIGGLAAATGLKITTIRYYERTGLMPAPARTAGRHRTYTDNHQRRLLFICRARELEFSIEEIRTLLVLADSGRNSCRDVHRLVDAHLMKLRKKITGLAKKESLLAATLAQCSGTLDVPCAALEMLNASD